MVFVNKGRVKEPKTPNNNYFCICIKHNYDQRATH